MLVAKAFPLRWMHLVAYRQLGWAWHALRGRRLRAHLGGAVAAVPMMGAMARERRRLRRSAAVSVDSAVPAAPIRARTGSSGA
jgi:hypothetical protein